MKPEPVKLPTPSNYILALEHQLSFGPFGQGYAEHHAPKKHEPEPSYHQPAPSYHPPTSYHPEPKHDVVSKYFTPKPYPTHQPDYSDVPDLFHDKPVHKPHHDPYHEPHHDPYAQSPHYSPFKPFEKPVCDHLANPEFWYPKPVPDIYHDTRCFDYPKPKPLVQLHEIKPYYPPKEHHHHKEEEHHEPDHHYKVKYDKLE